MKIVGKGGDAAPTRKIIADEGHTLKQFHSVVSRSLFVEGRL
jgi:hypothetical protein